MSTTELVIANDVGRVSERKVPSRWRHQSAEKSRYYMRYAAL